MRKGSAVWKGVQLLFGSGRGCMQESERVMLHLYVQCPAQLGLSRIAVQCNNMKS